MRILSQILFGAVLAPAVLSGSAVQNHSFAQQGPEPAAQQQYSSAYQERKREINENVVTIIASGTASTDSIFAEDMQNVLDQPDNPGGLRILPILGRGGGHNAMDILLLKGVDMGIMDASDLEILAEKDPAVFANTDNRLHYIAKLSNAEFQVLAQKRFRALKDLAGQKVNCFKKHSSSSLGCERIFGLLEINVEIVHLDPAEANEKLKSKAIAAIVSLGGAPHNAFAGFKPSDEVHFLPLDPETAQPEQFRKLLAYYSPAILKNEHYPELIAADAPVPTIASATLLVTYNWPPPTERYLRISNFVNEFFSNIEKFNAPARHPKWKEINLAAEVPGWTRFKPAQDWLSNWKGAGQDVSAEMRTAFAIFLKNQGGGGEISSAQREVLFSQFLQWWNAQKAQKTSQR